MKKLLIFLAVVLVSGCAYQPARQDGKDLPKEPNYEETEGVTGLGTSPFASGGKYTHTDANAMNNATNANAADIAVLQGYWAIVHAITGIVECDGAGTCAAADNILITGPAGAVGDEVVSITSDTSRDLAEFRGNVAAQDVNIRVTSNAADSSSGFWMSLVGQNKGGGISTGTVAGTTEMALGVGTSATNNFFEVMTGSAVKHVMAEDAPSLYQRAAGFGFGVEPSEFIHIEENSSRTNSVGNILRIDAVTDQDMVDGFGAQALFYVEDTAAVSNPIAAIAAVRSGADNSGALVLKTYNSGAAGDALELGADKKATFYGTIIHPAPVTTGTVLDSGDGNPATGSVAVAANTIPQSIVEDCQDTDTCTMTMSETGAVNGMRARVFNSIASVGNLTFATSAGVQSVRSARTLEPGESLEFEYRTDYWDETGESTGAYSGFDGSDVTVGGCTGSASVVNCSATDVLQDQDTDMGTGTLDLSGKTVIQPPGGWFFTDEDSSPTIAGQFKYDNTVTGLDDGALSWYDDDEVKYLVDLATLPTTNGQDLTYNSSTQKWTPAKKTYQKCTTALAVTASSDWAIERFPFAITISDIYVYQNGATNVIGGLDECTGTNGVCSSVTAVDADITGTDGAEVQDDGSLTNGGIAAGNRVMWHTTSVSGTNTDIQVCFDYTRD